MNIVINGDWITVLISIVALVISRTALKRENANMELGIFSLIDDREKTMMAIENTESNEYTQSCVSLCNAYEVACVQYYRRRLPRSTFKQMYGDMIVSMVESGTFKSIYNVENKNLTVPRTVRQQNFPNTTRFYNDICEERKSK